MSYAVPPAGGQSGGEGPAGEPDDPTYSGWGQAAGLEQDGAEGLAALFKTLRGPRPRSRPIREGRRPGRLEEQKPPINEPEAPPAREFVAPPALSPRNRFTEPGLRPDVVPEEREQAPQRRPASLEEDDWDSEPGWTLVDVAGRLAHDIRNPLTSLEVTGFVLGAELKGLNRPDLDALVAEIFEVRHRVTLGVDEFVEFARVAEGQLEISRDWTRLGDVVDDALRDARLYRSDAVVFRESPDRSDLVAFVDGPRIRLVIRSLVRYLLDYGQAPVRVEVKPDGDVFRLTVDDSDQTMTEDVLREVVERLEAGPSVGAAFGAGLGLFVCRPIIDAHGGALRAEAGLEGFTSFAITLPRHAHMR